MNSLFQTNQIMRVITITILFLVFCHSVLAQQSFSNPPSPAVMGLPHHKCLTDILIQNKISTDSDFNHRQQLMNNSILGHNQSGERSVLTIPVVVHVIHYNGPELIDEAQIFAGIEHLNQAFSNTGAYYDPNGVDTQIQFCLAQQDPDGNYTPGYTYTLSGLTDMNAESQDLLLKDLIRWDPNRYLNIWLVREITTFSMGSGVAGYAFFPSSQGQPEDGIVNEAALFGSSVNNSKVHIHEAGHYLGLYHTFEGGCTNNNCQIDGDRVCDTPPDNSTSVVSCNTSVNTCTSDEDDTGSNNPFRPIGLGGLGEQPDMFQNYMDYGFQSCQIYFSPGQATRMYAALETQRAILLQSNGCSSPCPQLPEIAINSSGNQTYVGSSISFQVADLIAESYEWYLDDGLISEVAGFTYQFDFAGEYELRLISHFPEIDCPQTTTLIITVICQAQASFVLSNNDDFSIGSTMLATNSSIGGTQYSWYVDGFLVTNEVNWQATYNAPGSHRVFLVASNGVCADSSYTAFFEIGDCNMNKVTSNWMYIGQHISFANEVPELLPFGLDIFPESLSQEATSSISEIDGNLLFYTDGLNVWNREFQLMPNGTGLIGNRSSTQGTLIVPHPGNPNQYYVFSNDAVENYMENGLFYSIVDLSLEGGMGDVLPSAKNVFITDSGSERLSATWHANGHDIWMVTANRSTSEHYAYLIDAAGIHLDPVVSFVGAPVDGNALGRIKFSHDGNRVAVFLLGWPWRIMLCDFDKEHGTFNNPMEILMSEQFNEQVYGLEFSPDNSKLYASPWQGNDLLQYDLSFTTLNEIQNSRTVIDPYEYATYSDITLGPDGKLYMRSAYGNKMDVIAQPNLAGAACEYILEPPGLFLDYLADQSLSMPNFMNGFNTPHQSSIAGPTNICVGGVQYTYGIMLGAQGTTLIWEHDGPSDFLVNEDGQQVILTSASSTGIDEIRVEIHNGCGITYDTLIINRNNPEELNLPESLYWCNVDLMLDAGPGFLTYSWQDYSNEQTIVVDEPGTYSVDALGVSGCVVHAQTVVLSDQTFPALNLGEDITLCQGEVAVLNANATYPHYQWQDGSQNSTFTAFLPGTYTLQVSDDCGFEDDDSVVITEQIPLLNLLFDGMEMICQDQLPITLTAPTGFSYFDWSTGANTSTIMINSIGDYSLTAVTQDGCYATDSFVVEDCIGVSDLDLDYRLYPNPASEGIYLHSKKAHVLGWSLYSVTGQLIQISDLQFSGSQFISLNQMADGVYYLRIDLESGSVEEKVIVQKK